jgi:hypothetical protein
MTRFLPLLLVVFVAVASSATPAVGCPSCKNAAASSMASDDADPAAVAAKQREDERTRSGYQWSILLMLASVMTLLGFVVALVVRTVRRIDAARAPVLRPGGSPHY